MWSTKEKKEFLKSDFYDALRWLFEGAVTWRAITTDPKRWRHQKVQGMYTSLVQARALYEFFYKTPKGDDASARHFVSSWTPIKTAPYKNYMARGQPAQKRVFHLVYGRSKHSGGTGHDGPDHLNEQVLSFALDLRQLIEEFARLADPQFQVLIEGALNEALAEANDAVRFYGIANPF